MTTPENRSELRALAMDGMAMHDSTAPEYIVCDALLKLLDAAALAVKAEPNSPVLQVAPPDALEKTATLVGWAALKFMDDEDVMRDLVRPAQKEFDRYRITLAAAPAVVLPQQPQAQQPIQDHLTPHYVAELLAQLDEEIARNRDVARLLIDQDLDGSRKWARGLLLTIPNGERRAIVSVDQATSHSGEAATAQPRKD